MRMLNEDIKAEVLVAYWLENQSISLDDLIIKPVGTFERSYSKDVIQIENEEETSDQKLELYISREGIYDMLPEGIFHQAQPKYNRSTEESVEESIRYNKEERAARLLFLPLEQEFYRQRISHESFELKYWLNNTQQENMKMLLHFWKLDAKVFSPKQSLALLSIMPHLHSIVGNLHTSAKSLEAVLDESVSIQIEQSKKEIIGDDLISVLGCATLGTDLILGSFWYCDEPSLQVTIGPIKRKNLDQFLSGGVQNSTLSILYGYLFPAEVAINTSIKVVEDEADFILFEEGLASHLGYSTVI
jgi:hypothetical protein